MKLEHLYGGGADPVLVFAPALSAPPGDLAQAQVFAFCGDQLLVRRDGQSGAAALPGLAAFQGFGLVEASRHYMGALRGVPAFVVDLGADAAAPEGWTFEGLRPLFSALDEATFQLGGRAFQIANWDRTHRFCGRCGTATAHCATDRARECPGCGLLSFPRVSPAVITLVYRGEQFLLARNGRFPKGRYSILAGFVEPGETLEEAVAREIHEEVGIQVKDIRYFGSQPWPFPHSLMVGFTAAWASGDLAIDGQEIVDAGWYSADRLPDLPDRVSISRRIIDAFLESVHR